MKRAHKKFINVIVFIGLAYFVTRPMYYPGVGDNPRPRQMSVQIQAKNNIIGFKEMDDFLFLWSELLEQSFATPNLPAMLDVNTANEQKLSSRVQKWIKNQGWSVERFFYVGQRLNSIVKACRLKILAAQTSESLKLQLEQTKDEELRVTIQRLMNKQIQIYRTLNFSDCEI